ncbi:MAG TPA: hypothetical protein DCE42_13525, partial [Myxococcales bacterium]|nr:hypothetical protein [Myxococcales bacterium]
MKNVRLLNPLMVLALCLVGWCASISTAHAQSCDKPNMLIVLDNSNSMKKNNKLADANAAIKYIVNNFSKSLRFGLVTFCGNKKGDGVVIKQKITNTSNGKIINKLPTKLCYGTPIRKTMEIVREYFRTDLIPNDPKQPRGNFVLFVTDGRSTDGSGTANVKALRSIPVKGKTYTVKTYVVGFGQGVNPTELTSMAKAGGTSKYYQADNKTSLKNALNKIALQATAEVCDGKDN